jgi:thioredoxin 1
MPVLINFKICDNAKECNGIVVCPVGALSWNEKKKTIVIDNKKCISCGKCEKACMVNAIHVAKNDAEYKKIKKEIDDDKRRLSDLYIDRYGAQPINPAFIITPDKFKTEVLESNKLVAAELFNNDSIMCLLFSVPFKELFKGDIKYRKVETDDTLMKKYGVKKLPSLLFFKNGKLLGKIEGFYHKDKKKELTEKINKIISKS